MEEEENNTHKTHCPYCDKEYARKSHLVRHIGTEHEDNDIYKCPHCPQLFTRHDKYMQHVQVHSEPGYSCKICSQKFSRKEHLVRHMDRNHFIKSTESNPEKSYNCEQCPKSYNCKDHFVRHMESDHKVVAEDSTGGAGKKTICEYCGSIFARKDHFTRHIKMVHAPEETHKCGEYGQSFFTKDNLRNHLFSHRIEKGKTGAAPPKKRRKLNKSITNAITVVICMTVNKI